MVFVEFIDESKAELALKYLNKLNICERTLDIEYKTVKSDEKVDTKYNSYYFSDNNKSNKKESSSILEPIAERLGLTQPFPPKLAYKYRL